MTCVPGEDIDTEPALETNSLLRSAGGAGPGLRFVFPSLRPLLIPEGDGALVMGREAEGEARLGGNSVSRRHADLRRQGDQLVIRDLDSRNGVFVNGARHSEAALHRHDVVRLGDWVAVVGAGTDEAEDLLLGPRTDPQLHLGPTGRQLAVPAQRLAVTAISMVLEGETGTGKERFASAIHAWSGRKGPLVAINCAAVPEPLAEAELFGYREGAFTGAHRSSLGHFRTAHGGTLFLDEITDMPLAVQAKLLRTLEQKEVLPVGESRPVPIDVRIIAATQIPLERAVAEKRMRTDLHARLDGFTLRIPPLRERRDDIPSLFVHLLIRHGVAAPSLSPRLVESLCLYHWPLNVRELDFLASRLAALHGNEPILRRSHLPDRIRTGPPEPASEAAPSREELIAALARARGNLARAAATLGISRPRAYRLLGQTPERSRSGRKPR